MRVRPDMPACIAGKTVAMLHNWLWRPVESDIGMPLGSGFPAVCPASPFIGGIRGSALTSSWGCRYGGASGSRRGSRRSGAGGGSGSLCARMAGTQLAVFGLGQPGAGTQVRYRRPSVAETVVPEAWFRAVRAAQDMGVRTKQPPLRDEAGLPSRHQERFGCRGSGSPGRDVQCDRPRFGGCYRRPTRPNVVLEVGHTSSSPTETPI